MKKIKSSSEGINRAKEINTKLVTNKKIRINNPIRTNNQKRKIIIYIGLIILLFFPIKYTYRDGGTVVYKSLTYKIVIWHALLDTPENAFKTGTEIHIFPNNFIK